MRHDIYFKVCVSMKIELLFSGFDCSGNKKNEKRKEKRNLSFRCAKMVKDPACRS